MRSEVYTFKDVAMVSDPEDAAEKVYMMEKEIARLTAMVRDLQREVNALKYPNTKREYVYGQANDTSSI